MNCSVTVTFEERLREMHYYEDLMNILIDIESLAFKFAVELYVTSSSTQRCGTLLYITL